MRTENIRMMGDTELGKLLYQTHGNPIKISPTSLTDESGTLLEVDVDALCDTIQVEYLVPIKRKLVQKTLKEIIIAENLDDNIGGRSITDTFWNRSSLASCLYDLWPSHITERRSKELQALYPIDYLPIMGESATNILSIIGAESRTKFGRFTKRFAAYMFKTHQIKMTEEEVTMIGNWYNFHRLINKDYIIRVVNNFSWRDGCFGKAGSCWWGCYSESRDTLYYYGGFGVLFYPTDCEDFDDNEGIGRVWVYPVDDELAITFNSYGNDPKTAAAVVAKLLENLTGKPYFYGKRYVKNIDDDAEDGYPYINGDNLHNDDGGSKCFAIYSGEKPQDTINIYMEKQEGYFIDTRECYDCDDRFNEDDMTHADNGNWYCQSCYDERFTTCDSCGEEVRRDDTRSFRNDSGDYCDSCYNDLFSFSCYHCDEDFTDSETETTDENGNSYCERCASRVLTFCEVHGTSFSCECHECVEERETENAV